MLLDNNNVKSVLLYGSESWRVVRTDARRMEVFQQQMPQTNTPDLLVQYYIQPLNKEQEHQQGDYTQTPEVARTCAEDGAGPHPKGGLKMDTTSHLGGPNPAGVEL